MISQHRHRDLCGHLEITLFKVVLGFSNGLHATGNLPVEMLPSWIPSDPVPEPVPELKQVPGLTPVPEPTPTPKAKRSRKRNATMTVSYPKGDVVMGESSGTSIATLIHKAEKWAQSHPSPTPAETQGSTSDIGNIGSKHAFDETSTQVESLSKQRKEASGLPTIAGGLDLGRYTFQDEDFVDFDFVPALKGKVSFMIIAIFLFNCYIRYAKHAAAM